MTPRDLGARAGLAAIAWVAVALDALGIRRSFASHWDHSENKSDHDLSPATDPGYRHDPVREEAADTGRGSPRPVPGRAASIACVASGDPVEPGQESACPGFAVTVIDRATPALLHVKREMTWGLHPAGRVASLPDRIHLDAVPRRAGADALSSEETTEGNTCGPVRNKIITGRGCFGCQTKQSHHTDAMTAEDSSVQGGQNDAGSVEDRAHPLEHLA